jgi:hypothetical protein
MALQVAAALDDAFLCRLQSASAAIQAHGAIPRASAVLTATFAFYALRQRLK